MWIRQKHLTNLQVTCNHKILILANVNTATSIGCFGDLVFTGGQFGKVFSRNWKTKQSFELVDQVQAHKRQVLLISNYKQFIFTAAADQKVKQWSVKGFQLVSSISLEWIPNSVTVDNWTVLVGGPSRVFTFKLDDQDQVDDDSTQPLSAKEQNNLISKVESDSSSSPVLPIILSLVAAVAIVTAIAFLMHNFRFKTKAKHFSSQTDTSSQASGLETQTLVTQILKIALPGYKELFSRDFRLLKKIAEGGGGKVYVGEVLTAKWQTHGKQVVVKQIAGDF
jgi:hypothetical protein